MFTVVPARTAAESMRDHMARREVGDLAVGWLAVSDQRESYMASLMAELYDDACVVLTLRNKGFDNPNAFLSDLVDLLESEHATATEQLRDKSPAGPLGLIILAKAPLPVPDLSSPVVAPSWLPRVGGSLVHAYVVDLTWMAQAPLDSAESGAFRLGRGLYDLQGSLIRRMEMAYAVDKCVGDRLLHETNRANRDFATILNVYRTAHGMVLNADSFRPSRNDRDCLISELWRLSERTKRDCWPNIADCIACALALPEVQGVSWSMSFFGQIGQSGTRVNDWRTKFCIDLLCLASTAAQIRQISGHADVRPSYSFQFLYAMTKELTLALSTQSRVLNLSDGQAF